jgi:pyrroline-5-carboxylate reductase
LAEGWRKHPDVQVRLVGRRDASRGLPGDWADVVVLAVKPKDVRAAVEMHRRAIGDRPVISVAAGISREQLADWLGRRSGIGRAMPNVCAAVGAAVTAICGPEDEPEWEETATRLFALVGRTVVLPETAEPALDAVTALSGSGPAYFYEIIATLAHAGEMLGLDGELARWLAAETARGAALMMLAHPERPVGQLIGQVASPGGTTEAALTLLRTHGLGALLEEAVQQAAERAEQLRASPSATPRVSSV